jgi:histidine triad (HIT) family protein
MASIFTRIIKGEIPCYKIAENEHFFAFLDIRPIAEGHTLVVPKQEVDYLFDLEDERLAQMTVWAKKIAQAIDKSLNPLRTGLIVQGLEVPHAHIHLIPLYQASQEMSLAHPQEVDQERMSHIAESIRQAYEEGNI